jgi:hypothetical protein|tara:strand:+ start:222 stop:380 length:159 start_codon:yes stop_codon:yes gene_type:complete
MKIHEYNQMMKYLTRPANSGGKKSGPPPKRGPNPQGLNIPNKKVKVVRLEKK